MTRRTLLVVVVCALCAGVAAAERKWEKGTWRETKIERPKVMFGVQARDPNSNVPRTAAAREIRTYVIDTGTHSLELRQDATVETPQIDAVIGDTVLIAVEKKTVYVKDSTGKEHKLSLRKQTPHER
jgi:hypothetical protein